MQVYTQAGCGEGEVLLPANFRLDTAPCPASYTCEDAADTEAVLATIEPEAAEVRQRAREYLDQFVCGEASRCLPVNHVSPFTAENIYLSFNSPDLICMKNPCPLLDGTKQEVYLDEDGYQRCRKIFGVNFSDAIEAKCRKNQVKRGGQCVQRFRGFWGGRGEN